TPETWEIFWARRVSAKSSTWGKGMIFDVNARVRIGASAGLTLLYTGGLAKSDGNKLPEALMAACTSCSAISMLRSKLNCKVMMEEPLDEVERICLRPGIWPNWRSRGAVIAVEITSGLAPG